MMFRKNSPLFFILFLLLTLLFLIGYLNSDLRKKGEKEKFEIDSHLITKVTIKPRKGPEVFFERKNNGWFLQNNSCDGKKISTLLELLSKLKPSHEVTNKEENLALFGFNSEREIEMVLTFINSSKKDFLIGREDFGAGGT